MQALVRERSSTTKARTRPAPPVPSSSKGVVATIAPAPELAKAAPASSDAKPGGGKERRRQLAPAVGARLRERRQAFGLTEEEVVERIVRTPDEIRENRSALARTTLSQYERGVVLPHIDMLIRIAPVLQTTPMWLLFGQGPEGVTGEVYWDAKSKGWVDAESWGIPTEFLEKAYPSISLRRVAIVTERSRAVGVNPGEAAIVVRDVEPTTDWMEMVFSRRNTTYLGHVRKIDGSFDISVADANLTETLPTLSVLGKVIGFVTLLNTN